MSPFFVKQGKNKINPPFIVRACDKNVVLKESRENIEISCYRSFKIASFEREKGVSFFGFQNLGEGGSGPIAPPPLRRAWKFSI